jgi:hypothetical protein
MPSRDGHEGHGVWVESDLLDVAGHLLADFLEASLQHTMCCINDTLLKVKVFNMQEQLL